MTRLSLLFLRTARSLLRCTNTREVYSNLALHNPPLFGYLCLLALMLRDFLQHERCTDDLVIRMLPSCIWSLSSKNWTLAHNPLFLELDSTVTVALTVRPRICVLATMIIEVGDDIG